MLGSISAPQGLFFTPNIDAQLRFLFKHSPEQIAKFTAMRPGGLPDSPYTSLAEAARGIFDSAMMNDAFAGAPAAIQPQRFVSSSKELGDSKEIIEKRKEITRKAYEEMKGINDKGKSIALSAFETFLSKVKNDPSDIPPFDPTHLQGLDSSHLKALNPAQMVALERGIGKHTILSVQWSKDIGNSLQNQFEKEFLIAPTR